jgi:hypothetical protein
MYHRVKAVANSVYFEKCRCVRKLTKETFKETMRPAQVRTRMGALQLAKLFLRLPDRVYQAHGYAARARSWSLDPARYHVLS